MRKSALKLSVILISGFFWLPVSLVTAASDVKLYLSPAAGTLSPGATLTLNLMEDSGLEAINAVSTHITFPGNTLQFLSVEPSDKLSFSGDNYKDGVINIVQGTNKSLTGSQLVATINFKVIGNSGTANVVVDPVISDDNSSVISYDSHKNILTTVSSGSYSISQSAGSPQPSASSPQSSTSPSKPAIAPSSLDQNQAFPSVSSDKKASTTPSSTSTSGATAVSNGGEQNVAIDQPNPRKSLADKIVLLSLVPALVLAIIAARHINRKYIKGRGFISRVRRRRSSARRYETVADIAARVNKLHPDTANETVAEIAARISRDQPDTKNETVAELAARLRRKAKKKASKRSVKRKKRHKSL